MNAVSGCVCDLLPFLGITFDVARFTSFVGHFGVRFQLFRILDDLREGHLAAHHERGLVAGLAAEIAVFALCKPLVRLDH